MFNQLRNQSIGETIMSATVVDNLDPQQMGRVRIRAADVHDGVPVEHLPWALVVGAFGRGPTTTVGAVNVPMVGVRVLVLFQEGDPDQPLVLGAVPDVNTFPTLFKTNYTKRSGWALANGTYFFLDEETHDLELHHRGTKVVVNAEGTITITAAKDVVANVAGDVTVNVTGGANVAVGEDAVLNVTGDATVAVGGNLASSAADWTHTGPLNLSGNLTLTGNLAATGTSFTHNSKSVGATHTHGGVNTGGGNTAPPN